jgi:hypothetical protein
MTLTIAMAERTTGIEVLDYLDREAEVPVLTGTQRQGDVIVVPHRPGLVAGAKPVDETIPVVRGENGGNTHALVADGPCTWAARERVSATEPDLGTLTVEEGSTAFLAHPEHGFLGIGPGQYTLRRQVEETDRRELVAD